MVTVYFAYISSHSPIKKELSDVFFGTVYFLMEIFPARSQHFIRMNTNFHLIARKDALCYKTKVGWDAHKFSLKRLLDFILFSSIELLQDVLEK